VTDGVTTTGVTIFLPMWGSIDREMPLALCFMMRARGNAIGNRTAPNTPHSPKLWPLFFAIAPVTIPSRRQIQMRLTMIPSLPSGGGMASSEWWSVKERGTGSWVGRSDANLYLLTIHRHSVKPPAGAHEVDPLDAPLRLGGPGPRWSVRSAVAYKKKRQDVSRTDEVIGRALHAHH
jgi:hypothetical protein